MEIPRVIPCLLLRRTGLIKTVRFKDAKYIGDAINAVRIFNEKEVDELIVLDTLATPEGTAPQLEYIRALATECFMPLCYGGGVRTLKQIESLFCTGTEKVALNTAAIESPLLVREAARTFGSQSIMVSIDAKRDIFGRYAVYSRGGRKRHALSPVEHAKRMEGAGAGEILIHSIDRDGTREGYDQELVSAVCDAVSVPVVASGGAGTLVHFQNAISCGAAAVSAGSMFVFHGRQRAVLITYPSRCELRDTFCTR
jgi:cyclase